MPAVLVSIISFALGSFVMRLFTALGISLISYAALSTLVESLIDLIEPQFNSLPVAVVNILALANVPEGLSVLASAVLTRAAIKSASVFVGVAK